MLKKSASFVLASFRPSRLRRNPSEDGSTGGDFPFAKMYLCGRTTPRSAVDTSSGLHSLRPCLRRGVSWHAWAGRVRPVAMLRIPYDSVLSPNTSWLACRPL